MLLQPNLHMGSKPKEAEDRAAAYMTQGQELRSKYLEAVEECKQHREATKETRSHC